MNGYTFKTIPKIWIHLIKQHEIITVKMALRKSASGR